MLNGFGTVVNALGKRVKPFIPQICGTILWRLNNKAAKVRQQAADLTARIANVMMLCQEVGGLILLTLMDSQSNQSIQLAGEINGSLRPSVV